MSIVADRKSPLAAIRPALAADRLTALSIVVVLAILALTAAIVIKDQRDVWIAAGRDSENLRLALTRDIVRNFEILDRSLQELIGALDEPGIDDAGAGIRRRALFDSSVTAQDLGAVLVVDAAGHVVEDSTSLVPHALDFSGREDFIAQRDGLAGGLFISQPYRSRLVEGDTRISLTRRRPAPDGSFRGVVMASISLAFFKRLFERLDIGPHGTITLFRDDGRILVRYPSQDGDIGRDLSQASTFHRFASMESGQFVDRAKIDGVERLYTFGRLAGMPLILTVSRATDDIVGPWWLRPHLIIPVLTVLLAATAISTLLFRRELRRRMLAEGRAREIAEQLARLARTDSLTGLRNRRDFDDGFDREWRRAARKPRSIVGLLMIDVDCFKAFNDTQGHQAGDVALRRVADCIRGLVEGPDGIAARFGGEEFVVLLPGSSRDMAASLAERICSAVSALAIDHPGSPHGRVTVSIGAASCRPYQGSSGSDLLEAADLALYAAKREGRNRVRVGSLAPPAETVSRPVLAA